MTKNCKFCNKTFLKRKEYGLSTWSKAKYCSTDCKKKAMVGQIGYWRGKTRTYKNPKERARKISETMKGKAPKWLVNQKGENHPSWKDGRSKTREYQNHFHRRRKARIRATRKENGTHTLAEWEHLKALYQWTCPRCFSKEPMIKLTEDHIVPIAKGGNDNISNIQPLCGSCNSRKFTKIIKYEPRQK